VNYTFGRGADRRGHVPVALHRYRRRSDRQPLQRPLGSPSWPTFAVTDLGLGRAAVRAVVLQVGVAGFLLGALLAVRLRP
jgi:hypothetical protein